jgi:CRISPR-associated protein (TIGR02584 family)
MTPCILVGDLGPNPAPLAEALWALARHHDLRVRAAFLLTFERGARYLDREFLAPGAALDQLHGALGADVLPRGAVHLHRAHDVDGDALDDDSLPPHALAWNEARWRTALAALTAAGDDPVIFALLGGRRRSMSALDAVVFQMLARPQDRLLDVRVSDPRVEGGSGFFFPEQRVRYVKGRDGAMIDARSVAVRLVDLPVPKLRRLLGERPPATYAEALARTDVAVERTPPMLTIDLAARTARVGEHPLALTSRHLAWYATLALCRGATTGDGAVSSDDFEPRLHRTLHRMKALDPSWQPTSEALAKLLAVSAATPSTPWSAIAANEEWSNLRSTTRKAVKDAVEALGLAREVASRFVPTSTITHVSAVKITLTRLALDPSRIEVVPPSP